MGKINWQKIMLFYEFDEYMFDASEKHDWDTSLRGAHLTRDQPPVLLLNFCWFRMPSHRTNQTLHNNFSQYLQSMDQFMLILL